MSGKFHQYYLTETLSKKYSHTTYLASPTNPQREHGEPEHQVALTVFASSLFRFPHERESLLQKAQCIKQLRHPHLIPILDMGIVEEQPFVVREYLPNGSLRSRLKKLSPERLQLLDVLNMVLQVGEALVYAHEHTIVHGNIKPENILFDANDLAILTDFSLVGRYDAIIRDQAAEEYAFCYLAPEHFAGICDARSDQYALGCLTYELITGRVPFAAQSLASMMGHQSSSVLVPLSERVADLPPSLEAAVLKTLAKDPDERFFDFSLFLEIIRSILSPPPVFPLARSARSYENGTISRLTQAAEVESLLSPIRRRVTKGTAPEPSEEPEASPNAESLLSPIRRHAAKPAVPEPSKESEASLNAEVERAEPEGTLSASDASIPEWTGSVPPSEDLAFHLQFTSPLSGETNRVDKRANEEEALNWLLTDPFMKQEEDVSSALVTLGLEHENNEYAVKEMTLALASSTNVYAPRPKQLLHRRRRVLERAFFLSVIMALLAYVLWPLMMGTSGTSLHTTNKKRLVIPQIPSVSTTLVPVPVIPVQTAQASVTNIPTAQSSVPVTNIPTVIVAPTPTPTPTPMPPISYEAESSQNTLGGGAEVGACAGCSGGKRVIFLGHQPNGQSGTLQFNNVNKSITGNYMMTIYYTEGDKGGRTGYVSVNGGPAIAFTGAYTGDWNNVETVNMTISLSAGNNTIEFFNSQQWAPDIDKIVV